MERKSLVRKKEIVMELTNMIKNHKVVGIVNLHKVPASALQKIKKDLNGIAIIKMSKKSLISFALENCGLDKLKEHLKGQPALILSNTNPFKLSIILRENKSSAPAKVGDIAPKDIVVTAGPTDLSPGPAISTLTKVKIPAKVEGGKINILKDAVVCKKGEKITEDVAAALNLLKLEPMEIGIELLAACEDGLIYSKDILSMDPNYYLDSIVKASQQAFNLAVEIGYITKQTIETLLRKAFLNAKTLGLEAQILDKGVIEDLIAKANTQAEILKGKVNN